MAFSEKQMASIIQLFGVIADETYGLEREALDATKFIPMQGGVAPWLSAWGFKQVSEVGMAKFIADYSDDLPPVSRLMSAKTIGIKTIADSYAYSEFELNQWLQAGIDVSRDDAETARRKIDEKVDSVLLFGDNEQNVTGFFNNENVTVIESEAGASGKTDFEHKTLKEIVATFRSMKDASKTLSKNTITFDTVILPSSVYSYLETTDVSDYNQTTILDSLKSKFPSIKNWFQSDLLEGACANGVGRAVFYKLAPSIVSYVLPIPFKQKEPQAHSLHYAVPCYARIGGTVIKNLKGVLYVDGV